MANTTVMRLIKQTAYTIILFTTFILSSCDRDDIEDETTFVGNALPVNGAQEVPAVATSGTGIINANYSKLSRTLSYTVTWSGLSGPLAAAHIHGNAEAGYNASVKQGFAGVPNPTLYGASGTFRGTVYMDGINFKEEDLLSDKFYINLHTALRPGGEIRGQLVLRRP
jgi:hypothetical protein